MGVSRQLGEILLIQDVVLVSQFECTGRRRIRGDFYPRLFLRTRVGRVSAMEWS